MSSRANETDVSTGRRSVIVAGLTAPIWLPDLAASAAQEKPESSISPEPRRLATRPISGYARGSCPRAPGLAEFE